MYSTTDKATKVAIFAVSGLMVMKITVGVISGSISILAQAADSLLDMCAVFTSFVSIKIATRPADENHPFGHGKAENIGAIIQAILILLAGILIIYSSIQRMFQRDPLEFTEAGIVVMGISVVVSLILSRYLRKVARQRDSVSLAANAHNIAADVYSAAAVLTGLLIVRITGIYILDPIIAIGVALYILVIGVNVLRRSSPPLIDERLPQAEEILIVSILEEHSEHMVGFHKLRTRKAGNQRYIDLHMVVPQNINITDAHNITEHLEQDIRDSFSQTSIVIHIEPCDGKCEACSFPCNQTRIQYQQ